MHFLQFIVKMWDSKNNYRNKNNWRTYLYRCPAYTKLSEDSFLFPDPEQCDKYWTCTNGNSRRSLCPDGLVFHPDKEEGEDPCDLKHNVPDKCEGRSELQHPKPGGSITIIEFRIYIHVH